MIPLGLLDALPADARMIERADGFRLELGAIGRLDVRERRRPLRAARAILDEIAAELGGGEVGAIERAITGEGEHAALAAIRGATAVTSVAIVFGDDFYRLVLAGPCGPALDPIARRIALELPLGLAQHRRRWYGYTPPPGWGSLRRHTLITEWLAPAFPAARAMITMLPARPVAESEAGVLDRQLHEMRWQGYRSDAVVGPERVTTRAQLEGVRWSLVGAWLDGARAHTEVVVLSDDAFWYWMRLDHEDADPEAYRGVFAAVVDSVEPVPRLTAGRGAFEHLL